MSIELDRYVPSKKNYAIKWDSLRELRENFYAVDAVWVFKKKGEMFVSLGIVSLYDLNIEEMTPEYFRESFNSLSGGNPACTWNGEYMTTQSPIPLAEMVKLSEELTPVLNNLPDIPEGYDGWYRLSE